MASEDFNQKERRGSSWGVPSVIVSILSSTTLESFLFRHNKGCLTYSQSFRSCLGQMWSLNTPKIEMVELPLQHISSWCVSVHSHALGRAEIKWILGSEQSLWAWLVLVSCQACQECSRLWSGSPEVRLWTLHGQLLVHFHSHSPLVAATTRDLAYFPQSPKFFCSEVVSSFLFTDYFLSDIGRSWPLFLHIFFWPFSPSGILIVHTLV